MMNYKLSLSLILLLATSVIAQTNKPISILKGFKNKMVLVKRGDFFFGNQFGDGNEDEQPRPAKVGDFYISQYEITVGEFKRFIKETNYKTVAEIEGSCLVYRFVSDTDRGWRDEKGISWRNPNFPQTDNHPVVCLAWEDAIEFCKWLSKKTGKNYRLPTEFEWEYAARNRGEKIKFPWGDSEPSGKESNFADRNTNFNWTDKNADDGFANTAPVGSFPPNKLGLYDLAGNAWEWCEDFFVPVKKDENSNTENRVMRGGSWINRASSQRVTLRNYDNPKKRYQNLGFRIVLSVVSK